jgi:hypothetical protein
MTPATSDRRSAAARHVGTDPGRCTSVLSANSSSTITSRRTKSATKNSASTFYVKNVKQCSGTLPSYSCAYGLHVLGRLQLNCFFDAPASRLLRRAGDQYAGHLAVALGGPTRSGQAVTVNGRIMSLSSCSRMWQW